MEDLRKIKSDLDVQIIGSDVSLRAIDTASKNMEHAEISRFATEGVVDPRRHPIINNPLVYGQHWPKISFPNATDEQPRNQVISFKERETEAFMSLYQGDFESIGH